MLLKRLFNSTSILKVSTINSEHRNNVATTSFALFHAFYAGSFSGTNMFALYFEVYMFLLEKATLHTGSPHNHSAIFSPISIQLLEKHMAYRGMYCIDTILCFESLHSFLDSSQFLTCIHGKDCGKLFNAKKVSRERSASKHYH